MDSTAMVTARPAEWLRAAIPSAMSICDSN
jgi:hypothetical protein